MTRKEKKYFGLNDVAEFCGVTASSLYYHMHNGHLTPHQRIGNSPMFLRADVVKFRNERFSPEGMTKLEIASKYGVSPSLVQSYQNQGKLKMLKGKRGRASLWSEKNVEEVFSKRTPQASTMPLKEE